MTDRRVWLVLAVMATLVGGATAQETTAEAEASAMDGLSGEGSAGAAGWGIDPVALWEDLFGATDFEVHGFYEARAGYRTRKDRYEKDMSLMETRLQVDVDGYADWGDVKFKGDVYGDLVDEQGHFDMREANVFLRPTDTVDVKVGRQILTWGTGDLIFINDLFPKDWQAFFIGRDTEYLKAPSDAVKASVFDVLEAVNVDVVYTPQFDRDRHITGERVSYWDGNVQRLAGQDRIVHTNKPDRWFRDDEWAVRVYKTVGNVELAAYGYWGYWKSPAGQTATGQALFPDLHVYGASARGPVGKGIGNVEVGYYESADDPDGDDPLIDNSQLRVLVGYTQEVAKDFTAGVQYYVEHMMDYGAYRANLPAGRAKDRNRHVVTLRLTRLMMNQNLRVSVFTYYSPSDEDVYLRPNVHYKATDNLALEAGANIFFGDEPQTFFGQLQNNTNLYTAVRYTF